MLYKKLGDTNTWDTTGVELKDATNVEVKKGIGKIKDTFRFDINNSNNRLTQRFFSGNGSTTAFTLPDEWDNIPTSFLDTDKFEVYVNGDLTTYDATPTGATEYSVSGTTLTFGAAPASGTENIEVRYEVISADDKVSIWFWQDLEWGSMTQNQKDAAFQMEGTVVNPGMTLDSDGGSKWTVNGTGIIEAIFAALAFSQPDTSTPKRPWYEIIQAVISQLNKYNPPEKKIYGQDSTEWSNLGNPVLKADGVTSFPDIQYSATYKRAIELVEELTQDRYTQDGQYIYYVARYSNGNYGLYVRYKDPTVSTGNLLTEGVTPTKITGKRKTDEVVNAIIYNCGFDPYERGMEYPNFNFASQSAIGSKWLYVTSTSHLGQGLVNNEFQADTSKWDLTTDGKRISNFPKNTAYPYTFTFYDRDVNGVIIGSKATASSDNDFADVIRNEAKWRGKEETDRIIKLYSNPRYSAEISKFQANSLAVGAAVNLVIPAYGLYIDNPLRLEEVTHSFWKTDLTFIEDETTAALRR